MWIHTSVCRTLFWTHESDTSVGTYSDLFEHWESIPPEIQQKIMAIHREMIDTINGRDRKSPPASWWDPVMVIDDEDV